MPERLRRNQFRCGLQVVDDWMQKKAWKEHSRFSSRVHVALNEDHDILAFFALQLLGEPVRETVGKFKSATQGYQGTFPVLSLAWLGVHHECQRGSGLRYGEQAVKQAVLVAAQTASVAGFFGLQVEAATEEAEEFFKSYDFEPYTGDKTRRLIMPVAKVLDIAQKLSG